VTAALDGLGTSTSLATVELNKDREPDTFYTASATGNLHMFCILFEPFLSRTLIIDPSQAMIYGGGTSLSRSYASTAITSPACERKVVEGTFMSCPVNRV